jgi:hypothetical protein
MYYDLHMLTKPFLHVMIYICQQSFFTCYDLHILTKPIYMYYDLHMLTKPF